MLSFTKHILITGGAGQLGSALQAARWPAGTVLHAPGRSELDLTSLTDVRQYLAATPFSIVINAAAYTAVDKAETDVIAAMTANALVPAVLATASAAAGIPILHVSTDYVFDGRSPRPYNESDPTNPIGVYGHSKRAGEHAVLAANTRTVVVRTAWVISSHGSNFLKTMLRLAADRASISVVADQQGCPTSAEDLAEAIAKMTERLLSDRDAPTGIYHLVNEGETTWAGLAQEIFIQSARMGGPSATIEPILTAAYPTAAERPMNSRLATARVERDYNVRLRPWQAAVAAIVSELSKKAQP